MLYLKAKNVAVVPVFDSERIGSLIKPISHNYVDIKHFITVKDAETDKVILETENYEDALTFMRKRKKDGKRSKYNMTAREDHIPLPLGERCDQGVVKYIGSEVTEVTYGDYIFFSGYTGTLMDIQDEGTFIVMEEKFIICKYDIDRKMEIPGLFFQDAFGRPLVATYEQAMNIMASTFTALGKTVNVGGEKMKMEDYNVGIET